MKKWVWHLSLVSLANFGTFFSLFAGELPSEQTAFFESRIRPVLAEKCYSCHSQKAEKVKGGLLLDTREGIRSGGDTGPAVVPGKIEKSLLIDAIRYKDPDTAMPPKKSGGKLPDAVIADFEAWIKMGAPDPREGGVKTTKANNPEAAKLWWSYQPIKTVSVPTPRDANWVRSDIDRFVLSALEEKSLQPAADADAAVLLRRLYFDLTGLPPAPDKIESFLSAVKLNRQQAIETVVDSLMATQQFGERWGRHWLDVARYAETSGRDVNVVFPEAWRYRDYVVDAFAQDMPFDQFVREQIAGDLLPHANDSERVKRQIATGFLALGPKSLNETNPRQFAVDLADEQIDATTQAFMGMTVSCARCHDHKFDPISQRDYTALAGIFLSTETCFGTPGGVQARNASTLITAPDSLHLPVTDHHADMATLKAKRERLAAIVKERDQALAERAGTGIRGEIPGGTSSTAKLTGFDIVRLITSAKQLELEVGAFREDGTLIPKYMGVREKPATAPMRRRQPGGPNRGSGFDSIADSPLFARGDIAKEGEKVPRGLPAFLSRGNDVRIPADASGRLELANWITSHKNPLTSRVIVNRVWYWLFGRGLVASLDNFGSMGSQPSHSELLDHLAARFMQQGWSIKKLVREIVLSHSYQTAASTISAGDPDNLLLAHANVRPLDAEAMRDAMLAASGALDLTPQVGSLVARAGDGPVGGERVQAIGDSTIAKANGNYRSIYLPIARNVIPDTLAIFDFADPSTVLGARQATIVPAQALYLLNSGFVNEQAEKLAARLVQSVPLTSGKAADRFEERFRLASLLVLGRVPFADETKAALEFAAKQRDADAKQTWTRLCRALFSSADYRFLN